MTFVLSREKVSREPRRSHDGERLKILQKSWQTTAAKEKLARKTGKDCPHENPERRRSGRATSCFLISNPVLDESNQPRRSASRRVDVVLFWARTAPTYSGVSRCFRPEGYSASFNLLRVPGGMRYSVNPRRLRGDHAVRKSSGRSEPVRWNVINHDLFALIQRRHKSSSPGSLPQGQL